MTTPRSDWMHPPDSRRSSPGCVPPRRHWRAGGRLRRASWFLSSWRRSCLSSWPSACSSLRERVADAARQVRGEVLLRPLAAEVLDLALLDPGRLAAPRVAHQVLLAGAFAPRVADHHEVSAAVVRVADADGHVGAGLELLVQLGDLGV